VSAGRPVIATPESLIELRRELHRHPELRFEEHRTAALVAERVAAAGWQVRSGIATTGVLATREGPEPGPHLLLRADMDALPVGDPKSVPYASRVPGVAHACGHDAHVAILVGVAERLAREALPAGRVSLVFQPGEERPFGEPSGAQAMLEDGLLDGRRPTAVLALHCWPYLPAGSIGIDERIAMAGKDAFRIELLGHPAHAASPSRGRDAILAAAQVVTGLHQAFARALDARDTAALNVGTLRGGTSQSVVAANAELTGTIRTVEAEVRSRLRETVERVAAAGAAMAGVGHTLTWSDAMPAIQNDPRLVRCAHEVGSDLLGSDRTVRLPEPPMTADDFALFAELAPALYLKLGVRGDPGGPGGAALHDGAFDIDERALGVGVAVLHELTLRLLRRPLDAWAR
jgi:amidohydrolase